MVPRLAAERVFSSYDGPLSLSPNLGGHPSAPMASVWGPDSRTGSGAFPTPADTEQSVPRGSLPVRFVFAPVSQPIQRLRCSREARDDLRLRADAVTSACAWVVSGEHYTSPR